MECCYTNTMQHPLNMHWDDMFVDNEFPKKMKRCAPWIMMILEKNVVKIRLLGSNTKFHMTHLQIATIETLNPISNHVDWMLQSLLNKHIIRMGLNWLWVIAYQRQLLVTKIFTSALLRYACFFGHGKFVYL